MTQHTKSGHITAAGKNVFADLGFSPKEAAALQTKSKCIISEKLAIKESSITALPMRMNKKLQRVDST